MLSPVHVVRIRVEDELPQWMTGSPKKQGHHFLVMMLKIEVDHYFFLILHLGPQSIPVAQFFCKETSNMCREIHAKKSPTQL